MRAEHVKSTSFEGFERNKSHEDFVSTKRNSSTDGQSVGATVKTTKHARSRDGGLDGSYSHNEIRQDYYSGDRVLR